MHVALMNLFLFLSPGGTKEITVTFAPDHASDHYSDGVRIELFNLVSQVYSEHVTLIVFFLKSICFHAYESQESCLG